MPKEQKAEPSKSSSSSGGHPFTFGKFIKGILIIVVFLIILLFSFRLFGQTGYGELTYYAGKEALESSQVGLAAESAWSKFSNFFVNPSAATTEYGFESEVEEYQYAPDIGVKISEFKQLSAPFEGEPIELQGSITATGIEDNLEVSATCSINEISGNLPMDSPIMASLYASISNGYKAKFFKDVPEVIETSCVFPFGIKAEKAINAREARLRVQYEFVTKATQKTYFLRGLELEQLKSTAIDPFEKYGIHEPNLNADNTMQSKTTAGPINLGIGTYTSQPFRENQPYPFGVSINQGTLGGYINQLKYLHLMVPSFIVLATDSEYTGQNKNLDMQVCDFVYTGQVDEYGFKIYELKPEVMQKINKDCDPLKLNKYSEVTEEECINLYKKSLDARCKFMAISLPNKPGLVYNFFRAEVRYIHEIYTTTTVLVKKLPETSLSKPGEEQGILSPLL